MMKKTNDKSKKKGQIKKALVFFLAFAVITSAIPLAKLFAAPTDPGQLTITSYNDNMFVEKEYENVMLKSDKSFLIRFNLAQSNNIANKYTVSFYTPGDYFFKSTDYINKIPSTAKIDFKGQMLDPAKLVTHADYEWKTIKHEIIVERVVQGSIDVKYKHRMYIYNPESGEYDIDITNCFVVDDGAGRKGFEYYDLNAANGKAFYPDKSTLDVIFNDIYRIPTDRYVYRLSEQVFGSRWVGGTGTDYFEIFVSNLAGMDESTIYDFELQLNDMPVKEHKSFLGRIALQISPERYRLRGNTIDNAKKEISIEEIDYSSNTEDFREHDCRAAVKFEIDAIKAFIDADKTFKYIGIDNTLAATEYDNVKLDIEIVGNNPAAGWAVNLPKLENIFIDYVKGTNVSDDRLIDDSTQKKKERFVLMKPDGNKYKYVFHIMNWDENISNNPFFTVTNSSPKLNGEKFILFRDLKESFCYRANPSVAIPARTTTAKIQNLPFYTYLNYTVKKQSINETYVYLTPYGIPGQYKIYKFNIAGSGNVFDDGNCEVTQIVDKATLMHIDYDAGDKIYIPINVSSSAEDGSRTYDIGVKFFPDEEKLDNEGIKSEVMIYDANADKNITIDVPTIIKTDNLSILRDDHIAGRPVRTAQFRITWNITEGIFETGDHNALLNTGTDEELWYEVKINSRIRDWVDITDTTKKERYQTFDIIHVERVTSGDHSGDILVWSESTGKAKGYYFSKKMIAENPNIWCDVSLHPLDGTWTNEIEKKDNVWANTHEKTEQLAGIYYPLKNINDFTTGFKRSDFALRSDYTIAYKKIATDAERRSVATNSFFKLSNTSDDPIGKNYFISMQGYYYSGGIPGDNIITETDHGVPVNIVLTETSEIVPIPNKLTIPGGDSITKDGFELIIDSVDPTVYANKMLEPIATKVIGKLSTGELKNEAKYEVVIGQNQQLLNDILNGVKTVETSQSNKIIYLYDNYDKAHPGSDHSSDPTYFTYSGLTNSLSDMDTVEVLAKAPSSDITTFNNIYLDYLRQGYVFVFRTENKWLKFTGLDNNQMYYVGARTALHVVDQSDKYKTSPNAVYDITSKLSKIYYLITGSDIVNPTDDERIPATPENFSLESSEDKSISLKWLTPAFKEEENIAYGFELVRVEGSELSDEDKESTRKMIDIAKGNYSEFGGYRLWTDDKDTTLKLEKWNKANEKYEVDHISSWQADATNHYYLTDNDVNPNTIYYYYLRSIKQMSTGAILHSEWTRLAATTVPISGITSLREISNNQLLQSYGINDFNVYYERVIAVEGPVGEGLVTGKRGTCKLPDDIGFDISKKKSIDTEYVSCDTNDYKTSPQYVLEAIYPQKEDTALYIYRLKNLESGTKYDVRVAVVDLSRPITPYPMSRYCTPISVRTEFNQDDYDKKEKYEVYDKYYRDQLEDLANELYYVLTEDKNSFAIKFKEDRFQGELGSTRETTYLLPTKDNVTNFTYYLSAYNIKELARLRKGLKFIYDGVEVVIPYNFINEEYTKAYGNIIDDTNDLNSGIEDFYLKLWFGLYNDTNYVQNYKVTSPRVQVAMKLIELSSINSDIDYAMDNIITEAVENDEDKFMVELEKELGGKIDDKGFSAFVEDKKDKLITQLQKRITSEISNYELDGYTLTDMYSPIQIRFRTSDQSSRIFTKPNLGNWTNTATTNSGVYAQAYMKTLGSAVNSSGADLAQKYGQESTSNAYLARTKYNLDPVFIRYGKLNPDTDTISKDLFIDIAFAICQIDSDDVFELAQQKKKIASMFKFYNTNLTRQEVVYGVMTLYNEFSNININNVVINNTLTSKNYNIKDYYKQPIYAGMQLGLITESDISNPNEVMTVNKMLDLIYKVLN